MGKLDDKRLEILEAKINNKPKKEIQKLQQDLDNMVKEREKVDSKIKGVQGWVDDNKKWIEPCIILALFLTGSTGIGCVMLTLWILETL
jgi:NifU-like protein involved in Fe-S cluster formation